MDGLCNLEQKDNSWVCKHCNMAFISAIVLCHEIVVKCLPTFSWSCWPWSLIWPFEDIHLESLVCNKAVHPGDSIFVTTTNNSSQQWVFVWGVGGLYSLLLVVSTNCKNLTVPSMFQGHIGRNWWMTQLLQVIVLLGGDPSDWSDLSCWSSN